MSSSGEGVVGTGPRKISITPGDVCDSQQCALSRILFRRLCALPPKKLTAELLLTGSVLEDSLTVSLWSAPPYSFFFVEFLTLEIIQVFSVF